ncbi:MAG: hypothetical protein PHW27_10905 [Melioribacteraceae bacterium]|nr:hypothetical protein [Melioribacteraceae bacterium]MDD3559068.1 hypothetical protein [Melioribacteraceae bacterium]
MENTIYTILFIIALLVIIELLSLPDWLGRILRGEKSKKELEREVAELEHRIEKLEEKINSN